MHRPLMSVSHMLFQHTYLPEGDTMLIDEILRALRDPEYRAQLTREARGALPDDVAVAGDSFDADQESEGES